MEFLPDRTRLPDGVLGRVHQPARADYSNYRDCIRWEFGFTCVLCFLHEQDLVEGGAEGTGLIWIEHHELKHGDEEKRNRYRNCLLSCRFCNNGRSTIPEAERAGSGRLLDPTSIAWSEHFEMKEHEMVVRSPSQDATYTFNTYHLGDKRKAVLRENRARRFRELWRAREKVAELVPRLTERARRSSDPMTKRELVDAARALERAYEAALAEVRRYEAIPPDAPAGCLCDAARQLPRWLAVQIQQI